MSKTKKTRLKSDGEQLVGAYGDKLVVRQKRADFGAVLPPKRTSVEQTRRLREEEAAKRTSPEMASIAADYMDHEDPNVRRLAASVLSQAG